MVNDLAKAGSLILKRSAVGKDAYVGRRTVRGVTYIGTVQKTGKDSWEWEIETKGTFGNKRVAGGKAANLAEGRIHVSESYGRIIRALPA